jgi:hypothetical protein
MIALIRKLFWFAVFLLATFCFIVLFEHGTTNFSQNARTEFSDLKAMLGKDVKRKADDTEAVTH